MEETQKHVCGRCSHIKGEGVFATRDEYLAHKCQKTGFKPTQLEHLGKVFESVSKKALERGEAKSKK